MQPTASIATLPLCRLSLFLDITLMSKLLATDLYIMLLGMCTLLFNFTIISPTMVMTTSPLFSPHSVRFLMPKVCQSFEFCDGFIYSPDLSAF